MRESEEKSSVDIFNELAKKLFDKRFSDNDGIDRIISLIQGGEEKVIEHFTTETEQGRLESAQIESNRMLVGLYAHGLRALHRSYGDPYWAIQGISGALMQGMINHTDAIVNNPRPTPENID